MSDDIKEYIIHRELASAIDNNLARIEALEAKGLLYGPTGLPGPTGPPGITGPTGPTGPRGPNTYQIIVPMELGTGMTAGTFVRLEEGLLGDTSTTVWPLRPPKWSLTVPIIDYTDSIIGYQGDVVGNSITTDSNDYIYVTGYYSGTVSMGDIVFTTLSNIHPSISGQRNAFIAKLDTAGRWIWVKDLVSQVAVGNLFPSAFSEGEDITVDSSGNVYVTGYFNGKVYFGSLGTVNSMNYSDDGFVVKYDSNGNLLWYAVIGGNGNDAGKGICVDTSGDAFITGYYTNDSPQSPLQVYPDTYTTLFSSYSSTSKFIFTAKINSSGVWQWAISSGLPVNTAFTADAEGHGIAFSDLNYVLTTGYITRQCDMHPSTSSSTIIPAAEPGTRKCMYYMGISNGSYPTFYFVNSNLDWSTGDIVGNRISIVKISPSIVHAYITGYFTNFIYFYYPFNFFNLWSIGSAGGKDAFLVAYRLIGGPLWYARSIGGASDDEGMGISAKLTTGINSDIYMTGYFTAPATFGTLSSPPSYGNKDIFVVKLSDYDNTTSSYIPTWEWVGSAGGSNDDQGYGVAVNYIDQIFATGFYKGPSATFGEITFTNKTGYDDIFISLLANQTTNQFGQLDDRQLNTKGILLEGGPGGSTRNVFFPIPIVPIFSGLIPGKDYYLDTNYQLTTTKATGNVFIGTALTDTKLLFHQKILVCL